jgi:phosphoglycolate phosphatase-like HAD superfamily hydrolase
MTKTFLRRDSSFVIRHSSFAQIGERMEKKLLLFDIDGTLLASGGAGLRAMEVAAAEMFGDGDLNGIEIAGRTDSLIARHVLARHRLEPTPERIAAYLDCYVRHLARLLPTLDGRLLPGVVELLDVLKARADMVLALLTGNLVRGAELKLTHYGVWHYFEFGAYADDHHDRNELGPVARRRAREMHGLEFPPERIFILGDTPHDVACAKAIGARAVAVATGKHTRADLAAHGPEFLFDDLRDIHAVLRVLER